MSPPTVRPSHPARSSTLKQQGHGQQHPRTLCRIAGDDLQQPLMTSCCYEGMRMLHAVRPAQLRRPRDGAAGIRAAPEGRRFKEAAAAHPAATRQGTVVGWPPRRCGKMAGQAFLWLLYFNFRSMSSFTPTVVDPFTMQARSSHLSAAQRIKSSLGPPRAGDGRHRHARLQWA